MKIPSELQIMDTIVKVDLDNKLIFKGNHLGESIFRENKIKLKSSSAEYPVTEDDLAQTFFHEVCHWIFTKLNEDELAQNEKLVDTFASCLVQVLKSGKIIK